TNQPEAIFLAGIPSDLTELRKAMLDETLPVLFAGDERAFRLLADTGNQAVYVTSAFAADASVSGVQEFVKNYQERFGEIPDVHADLAYDSARLLFDGLSQAKTLEAAKVREALAGLKQFGGITGPLSVGKDHWVARPVFIVRLHKDQPPRTVLFYLDAEATA